MPNTSPFSDDPKPIADAASLFDTDELRTFNAPPVAPKPVPKPTSDTDEIRVLDPSEPAIAARPASDTDEIRILEPASPSAPPSAAPAPAPPDSEAGFGTDEILSLIPPVSVPSPAAGPKPSAPPAADDGYGLIGGPPEVGEEEPPRPVELPTPEKKARRRPVEDDEPSASTRSRPLAEEGEEPEAPRRRRRRPVEFDELSEDDEDDNGAVADPLWSRWAEWGGTVVRVGAALLATLFVAGAIFQSGYLMTGFLAFLLGCAGTVLVSYPIVITMERPVRITPEQAVKDFYAAASHHFPHYKRMWLLLSSAGRESGPFRSFAEFRSAWERQIAAWKGDSAKKFTPLDFRVQNFQADKSVGQTSVWAEYTLRVRLREQEGGDHALATIRMAHGLVKGDDRMWYLNQGFPNSSDAD